MARAFPILLPLAMASLAVAQQPGVELRIPTQTLEVGEATDVQLVCTNTGVPETPEAAVPDGLDLLLTNETPAPFSGSFDINGRQMDWVTYTYSMRLVARKEGTYTLGPISVVAGGRTYKTDPVRIVVREVAIASTPRGDRLIWVEIEVEPRSLYVTQSVTATLEIGIRKVRIGGRSIKVDLFRGVLDQRACEFSVFSGAGGRQTLREPWLTDSSGVRHRYEVLRLVREIRAEQVGPMRIGPVFLKAKYPLAVRRGSFGRLEVTRAQKETARADATAVDVKGPPEQGRPDDFTGAIGQYKMHARAKPKRVEQGQPVTLTLSIAGRPLEGIAGPDLAKHPELASRFDYAKDELVGDLEGAFKVFRRAIFPKQQGKQPIPSVNWSYFDPAALRYVTLSSQPITITVDPPTSVTAPMALPGEADAAGSAITLTPLTGGLSPNYIDSGAVLVSGAFAPTTPWVALLIAPPLLCLALTLTTRHRGRLRADESLTRRRGAQRSARASIARALRRQDEASRLQGLAAALADYLADRFDLPPGTLTPPEAAALMTAHGADQQLDVASPLVGDAARIVAFLEACDAHKWCGGPRSASNQGETRTMARTAADVRRWIKQIEKATR